MIFESVYTLINYQNLSLIYQNLSRFIILINFIIYELLIKKFNYETRSILQASTFQKTMFGKDRVLFLFNFKCFFHRFPSFINTVFYSITSSFYSIYNIISNMFSFIRDKKSIFNNSIRINTNT